MIDEAVRHLVAAWDWLDSADCDIRQSLEFLDQEHQHKYEGDFTSITDEINSLQGTIDRLIGKLEGREE